jgi:hypothetical protein
MMAFRASSARSARLLKFTSTAITHLEQQIAAYRISTKKQRQKITGLEDELELSSDLLSSRSDSIPAHFIFGDLCHNRNVNPHGRRYSLDTPLWAREIHILSLIAYATIRSVLPSETLLRMAFFDCEHRVQSSLTNLSLVDELLTIWSLSNPVTLDTNHQIEAILAVDSVAIRAVITIYENGEIEGIDDVSNLTSPDMFTQFVAHPIKFHEFLFQYWDAAYSSLFVYQFQPLAPELACCAVHVVKATNDKGNEQTVGNLRKLQKSLI